MLPVAILAGGLATRLRPLTATIPKSLVSINREPFVAHQLRLLRDRGVDRVVMCLGHLGEMIRDVVAGGRDFGLAVEYSWDGPTPQGTGGAIRKALPLLGDAFFVTYGDSYLLCDYGAVETSFFASGKQALMTIFRNAGHWDTSNVEFRDGKIVAYDKRHRTPGMLHIDYGLGAFRRSMFEDLSPIPCDLATVYQQALAKDELEAFEVAHRFYEIGTVDGIQSLAEVLHMTSGNQAHQVDYE
jgi:N-acetyl-alpha-D-muramate 1-phosphate uridylyltransferase